MSQPVIEVEHLQKQYRLGTIGSGTLKGDLQRWWARIHGKEDPSVKIGQPVRQQNEIFMALQDVGFQVRKGDTLGIIGANGAGKSTLLKILSRITAPTQGEIRIKGRISSMLEVGTGFHGELTGRENIYLNGAILGMSRSEISRKIDRIIEFSECGTFIDTPVKRYSSGMYVKLAFSVAAHLDSEILIMDEVLAVGDMNFQKKCLGKMGDVAQQEGKTILYVSHNMSTIAQLCNRCIVLEKGRLLYDGEVDEAIRIYLDSNCGEKKLHYDLSEKRMKYLSSAVIPAKLLSLDIKGKESPIYTRGEPVVFMLKWIGYRKIEQIYLRVHVRFSDDSPVGVALSPPIEGLGINKRMERMVELDTSCLAPGSYKAAVVLFEKNVLGGYQDLDAVLPAFSFEVLPERSILWKGRVWGQIHFRDLKLQ